MGKLRFRSSAELPFRIDLQRAAQSYLAERGEHRFADWRVGLKGAALAALSLACYVLALRATTMWSFAPAYIAAIVMAMLLAINTLHDAAHGALFRNARLNQWLTRAASLPMGIDADIWTRRHVRLHHTYPNVDGYDLDIEPNPFLRQTPFQDWSPQFRYQHRYWPLVAALSLPYLCWYGDWLDLLGKSKLLQYNSQPIPAGGFLLGKLGHLVLLLALPWYCLSAGAIGWGGLLLCYLAGLMAASCFLVAMILGTHWAEVEFFRPEGEEMPHTWHEHQFLTCCDWQPRPRALGHLLGGLHLHLTHHLFPAYSHRHYPALARIVKEQARRHGLPYRCIGYQGLWRAQQNFLRGMGRRPE
ncbi:acyl-CoA desaturase [Chromobacterium vaccinii]|uniref:acyl-CoA desaturase n=1 Tax=Chromobacterium vaccinii TaxID=1108595 RepID=UPI000CE94408|nr:acyl-CoA desaturase [Chromobacterium vaccinii]AVG17404.1 acyl-CoA desaturase [Chromobacterium vaccinii]